MQSNVVAENEDWIRVQYGGRPVLVYTSDVFRAVIDSIVEGGSQVPPYHGILRKVTADKLVLNPWFQRHHQSEMVERFILGAIAGSAPSERDELLRMVAIVDSELVVPADHVVSLDLDPMWRRTRKD